MKMGMGIEKRWKPFTTIQPDEIDNLKFWYKADVGVLDAGSDPCDDGEDVVTWKDQSGNGYDLLQATGTQQPLWQDDQLNGHPAVQFDGIDDFMQVVFGHEYTQPNTIFIVFKDPTYVALTYIYSCAGSERFYQKADKYVIYAGTELFSTQPAGGTSWRLSRNLFNGASSAIYFDGVLKKSGNTGTASITALTLAAYGAGTSPSNPNIAEVIGYNANVSARDCALIRAYLNIKYAIY